MQLIQHFAAKSSIEEPALSDVLWTSSADSSIQIESVTRWTPATSGGRPAVIIKRNAWQVQRKGINDQHMGYTTIDGTDRYSVFMVGSHTLFCLANQPAEAETLAAEVFRHLLFSGPLLRRELRLARFAIAEVGELHELEEAAEHYTVPVTVAYAHEEAWTIKPHAPRLKKIDLSLFQP